MPKVGKVKFPYTAKGKKDAKKAVAKKDSKKELPAFLMKKMGKKK